MLCQRVGEIEYAVFTAAGTSPDDSVYKTRGRTNTFGGQRWGANLAFRTGLGKSLLPIFLKSRFGDLQVFPQYGTVLSREVWLIVHPQIRRLARIQSVMTWIGSVLSAV
jgi:DNA-binding transcriptional LysR family regulator